ncbi:MAG: helix-hairpin-helix domain-containing protein [Thermodesulfobacteriota bacterium]
MKPGKVARDRLKNLTDLPNIGRAGAADLRLLGVYAPHQLAGKCPYEMYERLCRITKCRHDPCVLDVFISVTRFMSGEEPRPWWEFTAERKARLACPHTGDAGDEER